MIKIAVVEDDERFVNQITQYLGDYQAEKKEHFDISVYRDGDGILHNYKAQYDIILMDVQMQFVDGMTAAEEIRKVDSKVIIIFITNVAQYAIRGYEVGALDYILKPITYFTFSQKLSKALARREKRSGGFVTIAVKGGLQRLEVADIYYIESEGHNLIYHTAKGDFVSSGTMKSVEEEMTKMHFSRGNKGYLINLEHVEGIRDKCAVVAGEKLLLSRARTSAFMQELTRYWSEVD